MVSMNVFNTTTSNAKFTLEYSIDDGATWIKAMTPANQVAAEVPSKTNGTCYWTMNLSNRKGSTFRISQTAGNKNSPVYVDDLTFYYSGEEGGPNMHEPGDVNGDGEVNIADVNAVINIILTGNGSPESIQYADVNEDGEVNIADVNMLIAMILN